MPPVIFAGGQAYTIQGQYAIPHPDVSIDCLFGTNLSVLMSSFGRIILKISASVMQCLTQSNACVVYLELF